MSLRVPASTETTVVVTLDAGTGGEVEKRTELLVDTRAGQVVRVTRFADNSLARSACARSSASSTPARRAGSPVRSSRPSPPLALACSSGPACRSRCAGSARPEPVASVVAFSDLQLWARSSGAQRSPLMTPIAHSRPRRRSSNRRTLRSSLLVALLSSASIAMASAADAIRSPPSSRRPLPTTR